MFVVIAILYVAVFALLIALLIRNNRVHDYRIDLIEQMFRFSDWEWRVEAYEEVSYFEQVLKFWKPLDSFYEDKSFLK